MHSLRSLFRPVGLDTPHKLPGHREIRRTAQLLGRFLVGQRTQFILAAGALIVEAAAAIFQVYPLAYLIDYLKGDQGPVLAAWGIPTLIAPEVDTIAFLTLAIILLAIVNATGDSLSEIYLAVAGRKLGYKLRVALYDHLQRLSLTFHHRRRTGDMLTRVTSDVTALEDFVINSLSDLAGSLFLLIGTLAYLLYRSWEVAAIAVLIVPVLALVSSYFTRRIKAAAGIQRSREGDLASAAQEMLTSVQAIQTFNSGEYEQERFADLSQSTMAVALVAARLQAQFTWVISVMQAFVTAAVIWLGLWLTSQEAITIGTLVLFVTLIQNMFKPTRKIIKEWNRIGKLQASVERIGELLERKPVVVDKPGARSAPSFQGKVEFRDVTFTYQAAMNGAAEEDDPSSDSQSALEKVSFTVAPGEALAIVGPTGAGKSSIVRLLPRLYDPTNGHILIDGQDIRGYTIDSLRQQIAMVLQETSIFSGNIGDNIRYGYPGADHKQVVAAARLAHAHEFIEDLPDGYSTHLSERGANLSGGQRQRIAIARAFLRDAPLLILDEPTTGLDPAATDIVMTALRKLMRDKTTIIISHDLNLIRHADNILVLKHGRIVEYGPHTRLLSAGGLYADLYQKQSGTTSQTIQNELAGQPSQQGLHTEKQGVL